MKITKMVYSGKNKDEVDIYVDNEHFMTLSCEVVLKLNLKPETELNLDLLDNMKSEQSITECYNKAIVLLSRNFKTKKQMKDYLIQKDYDTRVVNQTIEKLEKHDLINDEIYCKKYIEQEKNKKGKYAISWNLSQKGIDSKIIEKYISELDSQSETIKLIADKYMRNKSVDSKTIQKLKMYLAGKGFSFDEINIVAGKYYESRD